MLTFVTAPDYENPKDDGNNNSYEVKVTASDGTDDSAELTLTVNVTDVNEPPPQMEQPAFSASGTADTTSMLAPQVGQAYPSRRHPKNYRIRSAVQDAGRYQLDCT